jgi:hypothetical protein
LPRSIRQSKIRVKDFAEFPCEAVSNFCGETALTDSTPPNVTSDDDLSPGRTISNVRQDPQHISDVVLSADELISVAGIGLQLNNGLRRNDFWNAQIPTKRLKTREGDSLSS